MGSQNQNERHERILGECRDEVRRLEQQVKMNEKDFDLKALLVQARERLRIQEQIDLTRD